MSIPPVVAYKVLTASQQEQLQAEGVFHGAPVDLRDGYIHLSTGDQLAETIGKHFAGQTDLFVAAVDLKSLGDTIKWEESRGGQLFPHIYGPLPRSAVISTLPLERDVAGNPQLPLRT